MQLERAGVDVDAHRLAEEIEERDRLDQTRAVSPLAPASDAHTIDSSEIDAERRRRRDLRDRCGAAR